MTIFSQTPLGPEKENHMLPSVSHVGFVQMILCYMRCMWKFCCPGVEISQSKHASGWIWKKGPGSRNVLNPDESWLELRMENAKGRKSYVRLADKYIIWKKKSIIFSFRVIFASNSLQNFRQKCNYYFKRNFIKASYFSLFLKTVWWKPTSLLCSHSIRPSAVVSDTWLRRFSFSSGSIKSNAALRSSKRCSTRRLPRNGEVGDWQSKRPLV